mmetsp:Transcript_67472/g.187017  ORF Transcript_67472/g.187017 Transcript_67472/m.187017 type:complete len:139 (+) Transcript_67472:306-722(+)
MCSASRKSGFRLSLDDEAPPDPVARAGIAVSSCAETRPVTCWAAALAREPSRPSRKFLPGVELPEGSVVLLRIEERDGGGRGLAGAGTTLGVLDREGPLSRGDLGETRRLNCPLMPVNPEASASPFWSLLSFWFSFEL